MDLEREGEGFDFFPSRPSAQTHHLLQAESDAPAVVVWYPRAKKKSECECLMAYFNLPEDAASHGCLLGATSHLGVVCLA